MTVKYYATAFTGANTGVNASITDMHYRIWYGNGTAIYGSPVSLNAFLYSESPDGIVWYNQIAVSQVGTVLIIDPVKTALLFGTADAVYTVGASNTGVDWTFRMYYSQVMLFSGQQSATISLAFSANGYEWVGYNPAPDPLLNYTAAIPIMPITFTNLTFDTWNVLWFNVIEITPAYWEAFYFGNNNWGTAPPNGIGYATSTDGFTWTKVQTLLTSDVGPEWRNAGGFLQPSVNRLGCGHYQLWFVAMTNFTLYGPPAPMAVGFASLTRGCRGLPSGGLPAAAIAGICVVSGFVLFAIVMIVAASVLGSKSHRNLQ